MSNKRNIKIWERLIFFKNIAGMTFHLGWWNDYFDGWNIITQAYPVYVFRIKTFK
jgi:hypothetical protein